MVMDPNIRDLEGHLPKAGQPQKQFEAGKLNEVFTDGIPSIKEQP